MTMRQTRRRFLTTLSAAGAAGLVRAPVSLAAEGALETTTVRIAKDPAICLAPQYICEELLRAEGFTEIRFVESPPTLYLQAIERGEADFSTMEINFLLAKIDAGVPLIVLDRLQV
jgi:NitT/TauT family transport system substrate-binding protein